MKSQNLFRPAIKAVAMMMVAASMVFMSSCKDDNEDPTFPAPTISVSTTTASGLAGAKVTTSVVVDSPAGGKTLNILVNGASNASLPAVTLDGSESQTVPVEFTIPENAATGTNYVLTFTSIDKKDQNSNVGIFTVTVSDVPSKPLVQVTADITTNTTWTKGNIYVLTKLIRVGTDVRPGGATSGVAPEITATATLTIEAGTVIYGQPGTPGGGLIIQRGSKIIAEGTASEPIVFTSSKAPGSRVAGDWAGLVICGKAFNNSRGSASTGTNGIEELEGAYGAFHGAGEASDNEDNSGVLKYVRVEFAGYPINPNQEINGITFGSVGAGTTIDNVQVSYSNDDSYEWFGGAVNAKHLIAYKGIDDDFDTDNGFSGKVQFGLGLRDASYADQSGSNGFESDNDSGGTSNTPITNATFSNMTIIGGKAAKNTTINLQFQNGAQIRRNSQQDIINSFFTAYPNGIYVDNQLPGTVANATNGDLVLKNNVLAGVDGWGANGFGSAATADEQTVLGLSAAGSNHANNPRGFMVNVGVGAFSGGAFTLTTPAQINSKNGLPWFLDSNAVVAKWTDATLGLNANIFDALSGAPTFVPATGSILLEGGSVSGYTGFDDVSYRGAFGATDWTTGWANWTPQLTDYSKAN